ncbi:MAG: filamentous hemagglutinin N-terminal domain-containing protein [Thiomargarita sp.]|nr:filamentous hemagglutinin N-terminal domain-containing protein [Thiomargarita sp.]
MYAKSFTFISLLLTTCPLYAEVVLDGTLGHRGALEGPHYAIGAELGSQHGGNLFHSFSDFNINTGESATFSGPYTVKNVISRITGGNPSHINGVLSSTIPNADMYFLNPNGMMFGPNARLDVLGSFHASTAHTLYFQDGGQFNASQPNNSLLTIAPIKAFGFLDNHIAPISVEGQGEITQADWEINPVGLNVSEGKTLSLIGGNIKIKNGTFYRTVKVDEEGNESNIIKELPVILAPAGRINLASIARAGDVTLKPEDLQLSAQRGEVILENTYITTTKKGSSSGDIYIRAGRFFLDNARVQTNTFDEKEGGDINVQADELKAINGGVLTSASHSTGQGGRIIIKVSGKTEFSGGKILDEDIILPGGIKFDTLEGKKIILPSGLVVASLKGNGGTILLETGSLSLKEGAGINAATFGEGKGGDIKIKASDVISLSGISLFGIDSFNLSSSISASAKNKTEKAGGGGSIELEAKQLYLKNGALIGGFNFGKSQGSHLDIKVAENIVLSAGENKEASSILTIAMGEGDAGNIRLEAQKLTVQDGSTISAATMGAGKGGNINIQVDEVSLSGLDTQGEGSSILAATLSLSDLDIESGEILTDLLELADLLETENTGDGGTIELVADHLILKDDAIIGVGTFGTGHGGNINIQAKTIHLSSGGSIEAASEVQGNAGHVTLRVEETVKMQDSSINTEAFNAHGGDIDIQSLGYLYLIDSGITTSINAKDSSDGNILLNNAFIILDNSKIIAKTKSGEGGDIDITTKGIYTFLPSEIKASGDLNIQITVAKDALESLMILPAKFFEAKKQLQPSCSQRAKERSHFVVIKSEGIPNSPDDLLPSGPALSNQTAVLEYQPDLPKRLKTNLSNKNNEVEIVPPQLF